MAGILQVAFALALLAFFSAVAHGDGAAWGYFHGGIAPSGWATNYSTCAGRSQSPIDLERNSATYDSTLGALDLSGYLNPPGTASFNLVNTGKKVSVAVIGSGIFLTGAGLSGRYNLIEFHLHWGVDDKLGSEHTLGGSEFPAELHFVHLAERYNSMDEVLGLTEAGPLAVVGIFIEIGEGDNPAMAKLVDGLTNLTYESDVPVPLETFSLDDLMPNNRTGYFRYNGSLTTPPCSEVVVWTVLEKTITISEAQLSVLRGLYATPTGTMRNESYHISDNYRPIMALNDRRVLVSMETETSGSKPLIGGTAVTSLVAIFAFRIYNA